LPGVEADMKAAVLEAEQVAAAKGISVENNPYQTTVEVCRATAANVSSMRQDVLKKRRTEIDAINGAVVKEAASFGIKTPVNASLVGRIKEMEKGYGVRET
jgi:2-dehydropantoate 2-reductase